MALKLISQVGKQLMTTVQLQFPKQARPICAYFSSARDAKLLLLSYAGSTKDVKTSTVLNLPWKKDASNPLVFPHNNVVSTANGIFRALSTSVPRLSCEQKKSGSCSGYLFKRRTASPNTMGRSVTKSSRNNDGTKIVFSSLKYKQFQDKTRQNIKGRVSRLKGRVAYHNKHFQEKLSAQRLQGSLVVGKLRNKFQVKKENIKTIPNLLTTLRMSSAPVLAYLVVHDYFGVALCVFLAAGLTDLLDGYIARNFKNQRTALGTALDPLADKLLICFLTLSLTSADLIPVPMTVLILSRDAGLILASFYIRYMTLAPPRTLSRYFDVSHVTAKLYPSNISKVNTALQLLYVACTLASPVLHCVDHPLLQGLMHVTATTTFLSGADYLLTWRRRLKVVKNK